MGHTSLKRSDKLCMVTLNHLPQLGIKCLHACINNTTNTTDQDNHLCITQW